VPAHWQQKLGLLSAPLSAFDQARLERLPRGRVLWFAGGSVALPQTESAEFAALREIRRRRLPGNIYFSRVLSLNA